MAPLYHYLAHPQNGKLNATGESESSSARSGPPSLRRTSSINTSSIIAVLGGANASSGVSLPWDEKFYEELKKSNEDELAAIQKEEDEATEQAGDTEIQTARGKRAELYARIGDKDAAIAAYESLMEKTGILGSKIDIVLAIIRIAFFFDDKILVKKSIERCSALVESGGDWVSSRFRYSRVLACLTIATGPSQQIKGLPGSPLPHHSRTRFRRPSSHRLAQHFYQQRALLLLIPRRLRHPCRLRRPPSPRIQISRCRLSRDPRHYRLRRITRSSYRSLGRCLFQAYRH